MNKKVIDVVGPVYGALLQQQPWQTNTEKETTTARSLI